VTGDPWAFHLHPVAWSAVVVVAVVSVLVSRLGSDITGRTRRQRWQSAGAVVALAAATTWPLADLAAHWSLSALLLQRLLLTLVAAPLLLLSMPRPALAALTRPPPVDALVDLLTRPAVAIVVFSSVVVGTLVVPAVSAQASSVAGRGGFDALLLVAGLVLWAPALGTGPGTHPVSPVGRAAYLVVQSVLPNFPSVVFIFARHPLYPPFAHVHRALGFSALTDQQVAGIVAKIGTLPVLWTAAYRALARAQRVEEQAEDEPLYWADVERALERSARAERRLARSPRAGRDGASPGVAEDYSPPARPDPPPDGPDGPPGGPDTPGR